MLASTLLALALGQACPQPQPGGPPPCAAAAVPGCLPGYHEARDASGRRVYVCDAQPGAAYAPAPPAAPPPPPVYAAPPPAWRGAPPAYAPAPAYAAPAEALRPLALVFLPGTTSGLDPSRPDHGFGFAGGGVELRGVPNLRLRLALVGGSFGQVADATLKVLLVDRGPLRPFLGVGAGAASLTVGQGIDTGWRACGSLVGGLDLYLTPNFFLTAELQGRRFASTSADAAGGLDAHDLHQAAALLGVGLYL